MWKCPFYNNCLCLVFCHGLALRAKYLMSFGDFVQVLKKIQLHKYEVSSCDGMAVLLQVINGITDSYTFGMAQLLCG